MPRKVAASADPCAKTKARLAVAELDLVRLRQLNALLEADLDQYLDRPISTRASELGRDIYFALLAKVDALFSRVPRRIEGPLRWSLKFGSVSALTVTVYTAISASC